MKLTKDVNLLFFSALKNDIFLYFLCHSNRLVFNWYWVHTLIKIENLLSFLYIHLNQCAELLSKLFDANFKIYLE